ncbi:MAG: tar, partial [Ramlibacter sp.]|nr:tar [Ramlibacter sp.]
MGKLSTSALLGGTSIRVRLTLAFLMFSALLMLMAGVGSWQLAQLNQATRQMAAVSLPVERLAGDWLSEIKSNAPRLLVLAMSDDPQLKERLQPQTDAVNSRVSTLHDQVEALLEDQHAKDLFHDIEVARKAFLDARKTTMDKKAAGNGAEVDALMDSLMVPALSGYQASIKKLLDHFTAKVEADAAAAQATASSGQAVLLAVYLAGLVLVILFSWLVTRSITLPIQTALRAVQRVADGDLSLVVKTHLRDEVGQLLGAVGGMTHRLRQLVG